jgi:uncharacterized protein YegJ (DUF2314 family)
MSALIRIWNWLKNLPGRRAPEPVSIPPCDMDAEIADGEMPLISLVLLLRDERFLDERILTGLVNQAWDAELEAGDPQAAEFVVGQSPSFVIQFRNRHFLVNNFARTYVEDMQTAIREIKEVRLRRAFEEHRAWLSVDLLGECHDPCDVEEIYGLIGKLTAAMADDDCVALYAPQTGQMIPYDASLDEKLGGKRVLDVFSSIVEVPVMEVSSDDPRMRAAVREARRRWPEFVSAFERRQPGQNFAVKLAFHDDTCHEFMWVAVSALEGNRIYGKLDNDPVQVKNIRCGSYVHASIDELNDWAFTRGEDMFGGFTIKAIQAIHED